MEDDQIKNLLDGCEVNSLEYEGVIYVSKGKAWRLGEELEIKDWNSLLQEYMQDEFEFLTI